MRISLVAALCTAAIAALVATLPTHTEDEVQAPPASTRIRKVVDGVRMDVDLRPAAGAGAVHAGREVIATLTLTDAGSGEPLRHAVPRAWISAATSEEERGSCEEKVRRFSAGRLAARAEVDLNRNWVLAMNADNTISVIDANLAFDRTKLRSLVSLPAPAADWALHPDRTAVYVTVPEADQVSVIDTRTFLASGAIPTGTRPGRIAIAPDARRIWVANDGAGSVTVLDHEARAPIETLQVGAGPHRIAFGDRGRMAWITSDGDGSLHGFDAFTLEERIEVEVGGGPLFAAASPTARAVWIGRAAGELIEVRERDGAIRGRLEVPAGMTDLRFDPSGRWAFAVFADRGEVRIVDASSATIRAVVEGLAAPSTVRFSDRFAYLHEQGEAAITLLDLRALPNQGEPPLAKVHLGQNPPNAAAPAALAAPMAKLATGDGMIVASPADRTLVYYAEGMMAPMGALRNYGRVPRAVLLLDRSLFEVQPGVYRTRARLPAAGPHDLTVFLHQPRLALCAELAIAPAEGAAPKEKPIRIRPAFDPEELRLEAGVETRLRFRIEGAGGLAPEEIRVLAFRPPGTWQWRGHAAAASDEGFEVVLRPPRPGRLQILAGVPSRGLPLDEGHPVNLAVVGARTAGAAPATD